MTFLQPFILWGLPLVALPVLIHFINRTRHRPMQWAAMIFLTHARRSSTKFAKLRQLLILACRVLALLFLILALSRPLTGGWLGWALAGPPDAIIVLFDRSASMEARNLGENNTKRQTATKLLATALSKIGGAPRVIVIDSASMTPQDMPDPEMFLDSPILGPTGTAADIPGMLQAALDTIVADSTGTTEIWIASDLQGANWRPRDQRWTELVGKFRALPQRVTFRLLAMDQPVPGNIALALTDAVRYQVGGKGFLDVAFELTAASIQSQRLPVSIEINGQQTNIELPFEGQQLRVRHAIPLAEDDQGGIGRIRIPPDQNLQDNVAFFAYGAGKPLTAAVVAEQPAVARMLQLAAAPTPAAKRRSAAIQESLEGTDFDQDGLALLLYQGPPPTAADADRVQAFIEAGGTVLAFPASEAPAPFLAGLGWHEREDVERDSPYRVAAWNEDTGPLAKAASGKALPMQFLEIYQRHPLTGDGEILAQFDDGQPILVQQPLGKGLLVLCATSPSLTASNLYRGTVLVPVVQRLFTRGGRRFSGVDFGECGQWRGNDALSVLLGATDGDDAAIVAVSSHHPGVFMSSDARVVLNRSTDEDDLTVLQEETLKDLFGSLPYAALHEEQVDNGDLQSEVWALMITAVFLFLIVEGLLTMAPKPDLAGGGVLA